jgi:ABC-type Na+ efflux pump permease subunit
VDNPSFSVRDAEAAGSNPAFPTGHTPDTDKSAAYILAWYNTHSHKVSMVLSILLTDLAVVVGVFFFGYLRDRWGRTDLGSRLAPTLLAGVIIFAMSGVLGSGSLVALLDSPKHLTPEAAQALDFIQSDLATGATFAGVSIFMLASWMIIWKTRILPVWVAWISFVLGIVALAGPLGFFAFLATGIWLLIVTYFMWRHEQELPEGSLADLSGSSDGLPPSA